MDEIKKDLDESSKPGFWYKFKQQQQEAWIPRWNAGSISPFMIGIGLLLIPLGVVVLIITTESSTTIKEYQLDYTFCNNLANMTESCANYIRSPDIWTKGLSECECDVEFELPKKMKGEKIYVYYKLRNFYQNIRQYVKSRDDKQLKGKLGTPENPRKPVKDCEPFHEDEQGRYIYPCGATANSLFNDTIRLYYDDDILGEVEIKLQRKGIAWDSDKKFRYKNPPEFSDRNHPIWQKYAKPKDWNRTIWDLDPDDPDNNGVQNEDFIVWMRPAPFTDFQKLFRFIEAQDVWDDGLPAGKYRLRIKYTYEVTSFGGRKIIVLASPTIFGVQNFYQSISLMSVGGLYIVSGLLFFLCGCRSRYGKGAFLKRRSYEEDIFQ